MNIISNLSEEERRIKLHKVASDKVFSNKENNIVGNIALLWATLRRSRECNIEVGTFEDFLIWYYEMWKAGASHEDINNVIWL